MEIIEVQCELKCLDLLICVFVWMNLSEKWYSVYLDKVYSQMDFQTIQNQMTIWKF